MARPVQLAPGSLALVLSPREAGPASGDPSGGRALFRAFRRANARCFWDARLARAASRAAFLGWLQRGVLLVRAPQPCVQVLRDAWRRRALRPPRGFRISAVGDVFPVQMSPIAQCRFVPLAEVLCCAVSDMNAAQVAATQESLSEHLMKHYPGIAVPSADIIYSTLGALIQERKIYHTGEGYFIVTPNTYFITDPPLQGRKGALLSGAGCGAPASVTYLVSLESSAEAAREKGAPAAHCPSCRCFLDTSLQDSGEPLRATGQTRGNQAGPQAPAPAARTRAAPAAPGDAPVRGGPGPSPCAKDRDGFRKFGFSFLWRSLSRREKPRAGFRSFSAQFPPGEWPVRGADRVRDIPPDVERAILRRINPVLTVDSLLRHTALMQEYEGRKQCNSRGASTAGRPARPRCASTEGSPRRRGRPGKARRRGPSPRHRRRARGPGTELAPGGARLGEHPEIPAGAPGTQSPGEEIQRTGAPGSHPIYKKQITNPFQGAALRGHGVHRTRDLRPSSAGPAEKPSPGAGSAGPSEVSHGQDRQLPDELDAETVRGMEAPLHPGGGGGFGDGPVNGPPCSALPGRPGRRSFRESVWTGGVHDQENRAVPEVSEESHPRWDTILGTRDTQPGLASHAFSFSDPGSSAATPVDETVHHFRNLGLLDGPGGASHPRTRQRPGRGSEDPTREAFVPEAAILSVENEGLPDREWDEVASDQSDEGVDDDDGACSSLYLDDDDDSETDDLCHTLPGGSALYSFAGGGGWSRLGRPAATECDSKSHRFEPLAPERNRWYKATGFANAGEGPHPDLSADVRGLSSGTPFGCNYTGEPPVAHAQASAAAGGSLLACSTAGKTNFEAKTLQNSINDTGETPTGRRQSPPNREMKKHFTDKLQLFNTSRMPVPVLAPEPRQEHSPLEGMESYSAAGDSGIDSPRTQSLASNNSAILDGFKRRQNFLQNFEGTKKSQILTSNSLLQLTPAINV